MFDKAIIDNDKFMDLSMASKALYFLLGMEADDEGFVSYKKVMRVYGGNEDDVRVLAAKEFIIMFESGVIVITDWNSNNYLDKKRIKETKKKKKKSMLSLSRNKYKINTFTKSLGLDSGHEEIVDTPADQARSFFKKGDVYNSLLNEFSAKNDRVFVENEFNKFILYWTEMNKSGTRERWNLQQTFDVKRRLYTWLSRSKEFDNKSTTNKIAFT